MTLHHAKIRNREPGTICHDVGSAALFQKEATGNQKALPSRRHITQLLASATLVSACQSPGSHLNRPRTQDYELQTSLGLIRFEVYPERTPLLASWFANLVSVGAFDGTKFYRAGHLAGDPPRPRFVEGGMLSPYLLGESPLKPATAEAAGIPTLEAWESTNISGLTHTRGSVSFARDITGRGYAVADLVMSLEPIPGLDAGGSASADQRGFPVFGRITAGLDIVEAIAAIPATRETYVPFLRGQILAQPIMIERLIEKQRAQQN